MEKYTIKDKITFDKVMWNRNSESKVEEEFYKKTVKYIKFIKWVPWIKMIWIWNSISMNSAKEDSDIDLLIVTDNNKLWLVRILVTIIFQILQVRKDSKNHAWRFCLSFFCTLNWLDFWKFKLEKDPYLYFWILYFKPILNFNNTYNLFLEKNKQWADYSNFKKNIVENKKYIKYENSKINKYITKEYGVLNYFLNILNNLFKKTFLPKTIRSYNKINKPYWVIINDDILKFHNWDIRKEIAIRVKT